LTPEDVLDHLRKIIKLGEEKFGVKARLILCNVVGFGDYALRVAQLCKQYSDIVVGIDIAGYENGHVYKTEKELLMVAAMEYCKENGINRTVHAGETPAGASSVRNALQLFQPQRIGHGYHIVKDEQLFERVKRENIHIEMCPCSCYKIGGYWNSEPQNHPIKKFVEQEMNCSISTDDPGVFTNSLTSNYQLCVKEFQLTTKQLMQTNLNAARSSFLPENERQELVKYLEKEYAKVQIDAF